MMLSFDKWTVRVHSRESEKAIPEWTVAPSLLEDHYTVVDAVMVGSLLITLHNNADRVRMACIDSL